MAKTPSPTLFCSCTCYNAAGYITVLICFPIIIQSTYVTCVCVPQGIMFLYKLHNIFLQSSIRKIFRCILLYHVSCLLKVVSFINEITFDYRICSALFGNRYFRSFWGELRTRSKININTCAKFELYLNLKVRSCENDLALLIVHTSKIQALLLSSTRWSHSVGSGVLLLLFWSSYL